MTKGNRQRVHFVAVSEDEPIVWVKRDCSRLAAIRGGAEEMCTSAWRCWARKRYMREATKELDCPCWPHGVDEYGDPPEDCQCGSVEDGWHFQCAKGAPGASPVWRVEERPHRIRRRWALITAKLLWRRRSFSGRKAVLWGGRVERRATRLDRFFGCPGVVLLGDHWVKPEPIRWIYCDDCRCLTPRRAKGRPTCLSNRHGVRCSVPSLSTDQVGRGCA